MTSSCIQNEHRQPPQPPPLFNHTRVSIVNEAHWIVKKQRAALDKIATTFTPDTATFEQVVEAIARDDDRATIITRVLTFYASVSSDPELREASTQAQRELEAFYIESKTREDIYRLVEAVYQKKESLQLDPESLLYLEKLRKSYILNGLGIPQGPQRDRFIEKKRRLSSLTTEFKNALNEDDSCLWLTRDELDGIPDDVLSTLDRGSDKNEGKLRLTFKYPHLYPTLKYATRPETRQRVMIANENKSKCNENSQLFKEAIVLRDAMARLLGYENHAALKIEDQMAESPCAVHEFLNDLRSRLQPSAQKELYRLRKLKDEHCKAHDIHNDGNYYFWDHRYYQRLMLEKDYSVDELMIAEYFPVDSTVSGMLEIFENVMGLVFVKLNADELAWISPTKVPEDVTWHPETTIYSVWNDESEGNGFVGYLYMDLHPRPGKYGHMSNRNIQSGFTLKDGTRHYPATVLLCNFTQPTFEKPSLLKHHELVTLFHELGHGIHNLAGRSLYTRFHGAATSRDFVEAPSQMLENWCWTPTVLRKLSKHWNTGDRIPDDLCKSLIATKNVNSGLHHLGQLHFAAFDVACHCPTSYDEAMAINTSSLFNTLRTSITMMNGLEVQTQNNEWGHGDAILGHLMSGYDASLYSYLYAKVNAMDMFYSAFKRDPMDRQQGRRYRHVVLERGGGRNEMETLREFLGRDPSPEAFYQDLRI